MLPAYLAPDRLRRVVLHPAGTAVLALCIGAAVGGAAAFGPVYGVAGMLALAAGYGLLTSTSLGLVVVFGIIALLPFGTLPFRAIITPSLLSLALAGLLVVWVLRLLTHGDEYDLRITQVGLGLLGFLGFTLFSLVLGAAGCPTQLRSIITPSLSSGSCSSFPSSTVCAPATRCGLHYGCSSLWAVLRPWSGCCWWR